jgi:hypothetical protein
MHPTIITKKIIDFHKANFDNTFEAITVLQNHSEKMVGLFLEKATLFPEEGKKVITEWLESYKKGRQEFKDAVDRSFKKVEDFFVNGVKTMDFMGYCFEKTTTDSIRDVNDSINKESGAAETSVHKAADKRVKKSIIAGKPGAIGTGHPRKANNPVKK